MTGKKKLGLKKASRDIELRITYSPWIFFLSFTVMSAILSYAPLSLASKLFLGVLGILVPLGLALGAVSKTRPDKSLLDQQEALPPMGLTIFLLCAVAAFGLRFYRLTDWALWPNTDEGLNGRFALDLVRQWNGRFFYTFGQVPPLLIWALSIVLRFVESPLTGLWVVPAGFSFLAALLSYWAVRPYVSKSLSFVLFLLWCFSFWPLYDGRFCHEGVLLPLWALLVLGTLGRFLKIPTSHNRVPAAVTLGMVAGLGSFTFTPWPMLAFWLFLLVGSLCFGGRVKTPQVFWGFGAAFLLLNLPFLWAAIQEGFGHHIWGVSAARRYVSLQAQITTWCSYWTTPFWGCLEAEPAYTAFWGGMLNPLMTGAFFTGLIESFQYRSRPGVRWAWAGTLLCLVPGFMSLNVEMYRVILILPFLLAGVGLGLHRLLGEVIPRWRMGVLAGFILLSFFLDLGNFHTPFRSALSPEETLLRFHPTKPVNSFHAYQVLDQLSAKGPGLYFNDFSVEPYDQTVGVGIYRSNALLNPKLSFESAKWAAFIVNVNYEPFLAKQFPQGQWLWLDEKAGEANGGLILGIIPITETNRGTFQKWARVHGSFERLDWNWLNLADGVKGEPFLEQFQPVRSLLVGEPFLTALYFEKMAGLLYRDRAYPKDAEDLQKALSEGVPAAHLYYKLGSILLRKNQLKEARQALERATRCPFNQTRSQEALQMLNELEKQGGLPQP